MERGYGLKGGTPGGNYVIFSQSEARRGGFEGKGVEKAGELGRLARGENWGNEH